VLSRQASLRRRAARSAARSLSALALAALLALVASGCGGDDSDGDAAATDDPASSLEVTLDVDGSGPKQPETAEVSCPGSDACARLDGITESDFAQVPPTTACTEIFGGPEVATIEGDLDGEEVQATLTRANGCEIERFGTFIPVIKALFPDYRPGGELQP
jgi:hypothetical protein